jgi:Family of unknown function (DUF6527)
MYRVNRVDRLPSLLDTNVVYVSDEYGLAVLKCACGCGHRVTLLLDDGHVVNDVDGLADISPSIGVWDAACKSHFWIRRGEVTWAEEFSEGAIRTAMHRQMSRHLDRGSLQAWWKRLARRVAKFFRQRG